MINKDKVYHFGAGLVVALLVGAASFLWLGLLVGVLVAAGKEVYDSFHPEAHTVDGMDFVSTVVGVLVGIGGLGCFGLQ